MCFSLWAESIKNMSHFIASQITISKDKKTFSVKGGDNNVVPRSNNWIHDISINVLYSEIDSGNIAIQSKTEKALLIKSLVKSHVWDFGTWADETDYYHIFNMLHNKTIEDTKKSLDCFNEKLQTSKLNNYFLKCAKNTQTLYDNYSYWRKTFDDFNTKFLQDLYEALNTFSTKEECIVKVRDNAFVSALRRGGAYLTDEISHAKKFSAMRAQHVANRFGGVVV